MAKAGDARPVLTRSLLVRDIQLLATLDSTLGDIRDAAIYIEGNVIQWVGASKDLTEIHTKADEVISLPSRVIIPGLINTHHHMFQGLTRCLAQVNVAHSPSRPNHTFSQRYNCSVLFFVGRAAVWLAANLLWAMATSNGKRSHFDTHACLYA